MIKYILWDIDNTLIDFELAERNSILYCFNKFDIGNCSDYMLEDYKKINSKYWKELELGKISKRDVLVNRFVEFFRKYDIDENLAEDFNDFYQISLSTFSEFNPYAREVVEYFSKDYRQFGATNGTKIAQVGKLKRSGLDKLLEKVFISEEIGYEKPSVEFFDEIFAYTNDRNKDSYIIIGDSLTSDIKGAMNVGIKSVWYNPKKIKNDNFIMDYEIYSLNELKNLEF